MSGAPDPTGTPRGVIHDIGYRPYSGARESTWAQALTLYTTGLRHAWGLGRSGRSKVLPFLLLAINLVPATIMVGILTFTKMPALPLGYAPYTSLLLVVTSLFAAAQGPVLFSRDLRFRSIVLYLARPLPASAFALVRWASLASAVFLFMLLPTLLMYAGALLADLSWRDETPDLVKAVALQAVLALMLSGLVGLVSAWALRRGFAVVISIVSILVANSIVTIVGFLAQEERMDTVGQVTGLFSPWAMFNNVGRAWGAGNNTPTDLTGAWPALYLGWQLALAVLTAYVLVRRFQKVGAR